MEKRTPKHLSRGPRAPRHLKTKLGDGSGDNDPIAKIVVLIILLVFIGLGAAFLLTFGSEAEILDVDHASGRGEAEVLAQEKAFRPIEGVIANYQRWYAKPSEVLGDRSMDQRNFPKHSQLDGSTMSLGDAAKLAAMSRPDNWDELSKEEQQEYEEAHKILVEASQPYEPWQQDNDGLPEEATSALDRYRAKLMKFGGKIDPFVENRLKEIDALKHGPIVEVARVRADTYDRPGSTDLNLLREMHRGVKTPLPGGDKDDGPFMRPIQTESSWLAMDDLIRKVGTLTAGEIDAADNGSADFQGTHPEIVINQRGRVYTLKGRLFMLRKQPLRDTAYVDFQGKQVSEAYFGIVAYLRSHPNTKELTHHCAAFTTLTIPEELERYALEADAFTTNDDPLAFTPIDVELQGVYFRRFCFSEPVVKLSTDRRAESTENAEGEIVVSEYSTEAYMPWLISQELAQSEVERPTLEAIKATVDAVASGKMVTEEERQKFDEAGYYLCLQALAEDGNALSDLEARELVMRMLDDPSESEVYRGGHAKVAGILRDSYHVLTLRPNVSGKRHVYRAFVTDALNPKEVSEYFQWYVDLLEPPVRFQGEPSVMVDGFYYRSQLFVTRGGDGGLQEVRLPLLISKRLEYYDPSRFTSLHERQHESDGGGTIWWAIGAIIVIVLGVTLFIRAEKKQSSGDDMAMEHIRNRLQRARERAKDKSNGTEGKQSEEETDEA